MENKSVSSFKTALNYALITAVILIVYGLIMFLLGVGFETLKDIGWIQYIIVIGIMILAIRAQKIAQGGFLTYGKGFTVGFLMVLIAFVITGIYGYFYFTSIDPGMTEDIVAHSINTAEQNIRESNPDVSQAEIDQVISYAEKFTTPVWMVIWSLVSNLVVGTVISLIIPIFMMKKNPADI
ncbi:DUF4199 domain-containing protein [Bacteroidota bacterium]